MSKHGHSVEFDRVTWWIKFTGGKCLPEGDDGSCDPRSKKGRKWIYIRSGLDAKTELETILHETAHAADQRACEESIEEQGRVQAQLIWDMGWRPQGYKDPEE